MKVSYIVSPYNLCCNCNGNCNCVVIVCVQFLAKFEKRLAVNGVESNQDAIEIELIKACREARGKDDRLVRSL